MVSRVDGDGGGNVFGNLGSIGGLPSGDFSEDGTLISIAKWHQRSFLSYVTSVSKSSYRDRK